MSLYYRIPLNIMILYYNLVGAEVREEDFTEPFIDTCDLDSISPVEKYPYLPASSMEIDIEFRKIIQKLSENFENDDEVLKESYLRSVIGILNAVSSLNLLEPGDENYCLGFERLNFILLEVLKEINTSSIEEVIDFYIKIFKRDFRSILSKSKENPYMALFTFLAMNPNSDIPDYTIFKENTDIIDFQKLRELINKNLYTSTNFTTRVALFERLSYQKSLELQPKKN